jgi:creatinine amidohydrolase
MERVLPGTRPLNRINVPGAYSGIWWYGNYPEHYAGDAAPATTEKGKQLQELSLAGLAKFIKAVKEDEVTPELEKEFFEREAKIRE